MIEQPSTTSQSEASVEPFPWPPRERSAFDALAQTWTQSTFQPASFFRRMPRENDYGLVLAYYLIIGVVAAGIQLFWDAVFTSLGLPFWLVALSGGSETRMEAVVTFLLSPIILLAALFIAAGVVHLFLLILGGARHGFQSTTRVFAFSYSPQLFVVVPIVGWLVGTVWIFVLAIIGLRETHETSGGKAAAAVLLPLGLLLGLGMLIVFMMIALGMSDFGVGVRR